MAEASGSRIIWPSGGILRAGASYARGRFEDERRGGENGGAPWALNRKYCPVKELEFY